MLNGVASRALLHDTIGLQDSNPGSSQCLRALVPALYQQLVVLEGFIEVNCRGRADLPCSKCTSVGHNGVEGRPKLVQGRRLRQGPSEPLSELQRLILGRDVLESALHLHEGNVVVDSCFQGPNVPGEDGKVLQPSRGDIVITSHTPPHVDARVDSYLCLVAFTSATNLSGVGFLVLFVPIRRKTSYVVR